jgi:hypothetical protein
METTRMSIFRPFILLALLATLHSQDGSTTSPNFVITSNGKPITYDAAHASVIGLHAITIQSRVELALQHTVNYLREGAPRANPFITVSWSCVQTIKVFSQTTGSTNVDITKIEFQDFGPGVNDIGDILILASDASGNVYRCEKYDPGFCDAVDAVARLHFDDRQSDAKRLPHANLISLLDRPSRDSDISLEVFHRFVSLSEIRGVILVRHVGAEPISLADRWNTWGSRQWRIIIDGHDVLSDSRREWEKNYYTYTVLSDHVTRAIPFVLRETGTDDQSSWQFIPTENTVVNDGANGKVRLVHLPPLAFTTATRLQVILDASEPVPKRQDGNLPEVRPYGGQLCATSQLIDTADQVAAKLIGPDGPFPPLR